MSGKASNTLLISSRSIRIQKSPRSSIARVRRQALYRVRVGRDPALSRREDRAVPAEGSGEAIRRAAMADDPAHQHRPDVRPARAFPPLRPAGERLRSDPLRHRGAAALRSDGSAALDAAHICGDEYTIVDIATFPWLRNSVLLDIDIANRPNVKRYIDTVSARPAVQAAMAKIGQIKSNRDNATDDQKDRFFNRGRYARA